MMILSLEMLLNISSIFHKFVISFRLKYWIEYILVFFLNLYKQCSGKHYEMKYLLVVSSTEDDPETNV